MQFLYNITTLSAISILLVQGRLQHNIDSDRDQFGRWKEMHGKVYETAAFEEERFQIWKKNKQLISEHNMSLDKSFQLGLNEFSDLGAEEFNNRYTMDRFDSTTVPRKGNRFVPAYGFEPLEQIDWRKKGVVTKVKNQGQCGSCWSFSATGSLEGALVLAGHEQVVLSEQQLVDCDRSTKAPGSQAYDNGCNGGLMDNAFEYIREVGGLESEADYPYTAVDGTCKVQKSKFVGHVSGYTDIPSGDEHALMMAVAQYGPVSVAIDASNFTFQLYRGGVYQEPNCSPTNLDHGVLVVGYGEENGQKYWLVKNSWGASWGEQGYIKMARGANNMCGVASMASFPHVPAKFD